jgi:hypothetical protein
MTAEQWIIAALIVLVAAGAVVWVWHICTTGQDE